MNPRAELYQALAEALAEPPDWLALPGKEWPLFECVKLAAASSRTARDAVFALAQIRPDSLARRRARYRELFNGPSRPQFWLYESLHVHGKLAGPATFEVQHLYETTGVENPHAELPDHASLELAYLAYLADQQEREPERARLRRMLERRFIHKHAGRWLPEVGRGLEHSGDPVYGPVGGLLAGWLSEAAEPKSRTTTRQINLPVISTLGTCTLCGFCAQVCPTQALTIRESNTETALLLSPTACFGCAKCVQVCDNRTLEMKSPGTALTNRGGWELLRRSPRGSCPSCNTPTVSQAELDYLGAQLGYPGWLAYCLNCRSRFNERWI